jgi:RNA polymerase sigma-70 factor (ECF subfamily)
VSAPSTNPAGRGHLDRDDETLVQALHDRDEQVFNNLVERWSGIMLRLALTHVESRAVAEEVVQDAWLTVLRSLDRFERRSSLRTWVLGIVVNCARSRSRAERRSAVLSSEAAPIVAPTRFLPANHPRWPHHWAVEPAEWRTPEEELLAGETRKVIVDAVDALPSSQRQVIVLRDIEGLPSAEVCNILGLTDTHQRVLLHRARSRVRGALDRYVAATETT